MSHIVIRRAGSNVYIYLNLRLIKEDMENRLAKLKLDESTNEDQLKEKQQEIEQECVSSVRNGYMLNMFVFMRKL